VVADVDWRCTSCGARWSAGVFTTGCAECGGGALERACVICGGRCGRGARRMPADSNDARVAHWLFGCALPYGAQATAVRARERAGMSAARASPLRVASRVVPSGARGEDRVGVFELGDALVLVLADGAGGTGGGGEAADEVVQRCAADAFAHGGAGLDPQAVLRACDGALASAGRGEATGVVAVVASGRVRGASVGDSGAWLVAQGGVRDLTELQRRKPLLGSGTAEVRPFAATLAGSLLIGSDGLFKYARAEALAALARGPNEPGAALAAMIDAARLPTGALQDDLAVVLCCPASPDLKNHPQG
jgi:serine/threonine protein phosphatase PrpC